VSAPSNFVCQLKQVRFHSSAMRAGSRSASIRSAKLRFALRFAEQARTYSPISARRSAVNVESCLQALPAKQRNPHGLTPLNVNPQRVVQPLGDLVVSQTTVKPKQESE